MEVLPKGGRERVVPLSRDALAALKAYRHLRGPYVFCGANGKPHSYDVVREVAVPAACTAAGIQARDASCATAHLRLASRHARSAIAGGEGTPRPFGPESGPPVRAPGAEHHEGRRQATRRRQRSSGGVLTAKREDGTAEAYKDFDRFEQHHEGSSPSRPIRDHQSIRWLPSVRVRTSCPAFPGSPDVSTVVPAFPAYELAVAQMAANSDRLRWRTAMSGRKRYVASPVLESPESVPGSLREARREHTVDHQRVPLVDRSGRREGLPKRFSNGHSHTGKSPSP